MSDNNITPEQQIQIDQLREVLSLDVLDTTYALNIIISAVQVAYNNCDKFNEFDKALISKALNTFKSKSEMGEDFVIKVKE